MCSHGVARPATVSDLILRGALAGCQTCAANGTRCVQAALGPRPANSEPAAKLRPSLGRSPELQLLQLPKKLLEPMKAIAVIPARLASTRLERKALRDIAGLPMIGHVYRAVCASPLLDGVIIATDSQEIVDVCNKY